MSDADINLRAFLWQQTRPVAIRWGVLVLIAALGWGVAYHWVSSLESATAQARAERDAVAERKRALEDDARLIAAHREDYRRWVDSGLIGTLPVAERRALWLQQWQQALARRSDAALDHVALTLEPPQGSGSANAAAGVELQPQARDTEYAVTYHPLSLTVQGLTDLESLDIVQNLLRKLGAGAQLTACDWKRTESQAVPGVEVSCRARIVYIKLNDDPARTGATPMPDR